MGRYRKVFTDRGGNRERAWRLDNQKVSTPTSRLCDQGLLKVASLERSNWCVDLRLLSSEEMVAPLSGIGACQGPELSALGQGGADAIPDMGLVFGANLKSSFYELG